MAVRNGNAANQELLVSALRSIGDAVITTDMRATVTFVNPMAELLTGYSSQEALGNKSWEVFTVVEEGSGKQLRCPVQHVLDSGEPTGYLNHTALCCVDGSMRPISYNATPLRDVGGKMQGVVLVFHCMRGRVQASNTAQRLQLISKATNDAVWDWDLLTDRIWWNESVHTLFGYSADEVSSDPQWFFDHVHPADRERVWNSIETMKAGSRHWQAEYRFVNHDGSFSVVFERGYVLCDPLGKAVRMVGTMMDVTNRRNAQDELVSLNEELERRVEERTVELREANRELESFSYSVSHDLRSPLRNIIILSKLLEEGNLDKLDDESRDNLARLVLSAKRMSTLIEDLLQYSRLSRSRLNLEIVSLSSIAQSVADELKARTGSGATVSVQPDMTAEADAGLIRILFENLLGNALKFSATKASPEVQIGQAEQRGEQVFFVKDNGAGFDPLLKDKLFTPFERLHTTDEFEGTGIGLANVHRIVRRHGGRIWAEGQVGKGATFYFTL